MKPTSTFSITIDGEEKDIKMSFALLNIICRSVGDIDGALMLDIDQDLREAVLIELLSPRNEKGKISEPVDLMVADVTPQAVADILSWAGDHLMDFFLAALESTKAKQEKHKGRLAALMPTSTGLEISNGKTPSV
jgi:hypothetical protein